MHCLEDLIRHITSLLVSIAVVGSIGAGSANTVSYGISGHAHVLNTTAAVSGARVCAVSEITSLCQLTNKEGVFNLGPLPPRSYRVDATLAGYYTDCPSHWTVNIVDKAETLEVTLIPNGVSVDCYTVTVTPTQP